MQVGWVERPSRSTTVMPGSVPWQSRRWFSARRCSPRRHPTRGARPLKRVIEERVVTPIAAILAADASYRDREIQVRAEGNELIVG